VINTLGTIMCALLGFSRVRWCWCDTHVCFLKRCTRADAAYISTVPTLHQCHHMRAGVPFQACSLEVCSHRS
jgi:hypothetical protein